MTSHTGLSNAMFSNGENSGYDTHTWLGYVYPKGEIEVRREVSASASRIRATEKLS